MPGKINPQPVIPTVEHDYESPEDAFDVGNYPVAFDLADIGSELRACAQIMCGAIVPGLETLEAFHSERASHIKAYAKWCLNDEFHGNGIPDGPIDVLAFAMPGSDKIEAYKDADGFRVRTYGLDPDQFGITLTQILDELPPGWDPKLVISIDAYGPYLPVGVFDGSIPTAFWVGDHDFFFATRHADLARADVIVPNSAGEHVEMSKFYDGRIAAFPGHDTYGRSDEFPEKMVRKDYDIRFTGRAFTAYMRDKAQFLFNLATLDDADLKISIRDGYLSENEFATAMGGAKFVPSFCRYAGGFQTRAIDALRQHAYVLTPEAGICKNLIGGGEGGYASTHDRSAEEHLAAYPGDYPVHIKLHRKKFKDLFWPSPRREERFLKFCLFQTLLAEREKPKPCAPSYLPVELRGYDVDQGREVYARILKINLDAENMSAANYIHAAASAFYAAILVQGDQGLGQMALDIYQIGLDAYPNSLMLRFNYARALWVFGRRNQAAEQFQIIPGNARDFDYDPRIDAILSHRVRDMANMFPYGDYYTAAVKGGDAPRQIIASGAYTYLAVHLNDHGDRENAHSLLRKAVVECPENHVAWRYLTLISSAAEDVLEAFYQAVNLYPPELSELLSSGVKASMALSDENSAREMMRKWIMFQSRTGHSENLDNLQIIAEHRSLLSDWTGETFDRMVAQS